MLIQINWGVFQQERPYFERRKQLKSNAESYDQQVWARLWEVSEELTGL